ncbi:tRNA (adenosine(37)-N6)-threonylcarbamoyltransferase complex dimerization subunit type 1 TsaB [Aureimonas leprariae]|uniref:tRNA (Adenosine(37)-N6)-threonylcarbamoyltransferase complex dimerization subunit type 1 TsaB n=1 Tax=Plantimonas leprariae TaxID=2615207 RepID=A0A7V7TYI2_9HYPH|nr:tRNA (adenosine(37)-N6)-threonylcarbamoyltransferase complex dimerization subunit type 1 TsaB [Aureimonas leprariae]
MLAIDTAGSRCSVALVAGDGRALAARDPDLGRGHAERLMGLVGEVLEEAGAAYGDLSRIAVSVGPGSFTGLRVGVAAARGLALALGLPVVGVSTLEALAEPFRADGPTLAAIDAKRGEVWLAGFGPDDAVFLLPIAVALDGLPGALEALPVPAVVAGSGASILAASFPGARVENGEGRVDVVALARIAMRRSAGEPPRPLYLRGADAKPQRSGLSVRDSRDPDLAPTGPGGR